MTVPSDPAARQELKMMMTEATNCMKRIDGERDQMKEIFALGEEKFQIKKKTLRKLATTMHKHNYADIVSEAEQFELLYETLIENKKT